jgi:hypothetical protein
LQDRVAKLKGAKQLANHAARQARQNLQRQLNGQRTKEEDTVVMESDSEETPVRYWCIMGAHFLNWNEVHYVSGEFV